ncbi:MAG: replication initiation protein RepC [Methylocystaceae bacterium]|nr:MAG: replication initiation protein RepC [Methylocystaceae bacterium]
MRTHSTTPFGRRPLSLAMVAAQAATRDFAAKPDTSETVVHKWRLFRALTEAKGPLGVTDRALSVLHALLSFHQETALTLPEAEGRKGGESDSPGIVVFPSNRELSIRAHGMAPATLRRHLASLVEAGLIIRRDSPNGKRFARRGQGGEIAEAFGFDLAPLIARAAEIENLAEELRVENRAIALLRERITLVRRDIVKMIETGMEVGVRFTPLSINGKEIGEWEGLYRHSQALSARYSRGRGRAELEALAGDLAVLAAEIQNLLETHVKQLSAIYRIKSQTFLILNLAFQKAGRNRPGQCQKIPKPKGQGRQQPRRPVPERASDRGVRHEPIRSTWCCKPVPTSSITARAGRLPAGAISSTLRRSCAPRSASRPTPGNRRSTFWASMTARSSLPQSCSGARKSNPPAAICGC